MYLPSLLLVAAIYFQTFSLTKCEDCIDKILEDRLNDCCNIPEPFPLASFRVCARKARQNHAVASPLIHNCKMECYYKELGIISDLTLNMDRIKLHLENIEDRAREFYEATFQTCDDEINERKGNFMVAMCSSYAALLYECVQKKKNEHCPVEYLTESELCNQLKNGLKLCKH